METRRVGVLLASCTALISGIAVFTNSYGVRAWAEISDATTYTTLKNAAAALILVLLAVVSRRSPGPRPDLAAAREHWRGLALVALIGGSIPFVLFFEGLAQATSSNAAFIHKTLVVWVAILAVVFLRERVGLPHLGALVLLIWGQAALTGGVGGFGMAPGEWMIIAATMLWAIETVLAKRLLTSVPSSTLGVARMAGGAILLIAYGLARGALTELTGVTLEHLLWILLTAVTLSAYVATWYAALARAPAVDVTAVLVGGAIITGLLEFGVGRAAMPPAIGLVLIAVGVGLAIGAGWRRPSLAR